MSVVVAIKDEDRVWMACDSQVSKGWSKHTLTNKNNYKICRPNNEKDTLVGIVGSLKYQNALSVQDSFISELTVLKNEFNFKVMVEKIVPKLFNIANQYNTSSKVEGQDYKRLDSRVLFAHKDQLFSVSSDGAVTEIDGFASVGSGEDYAYGYLKQSEGEDVKSRIIKAVKSACETDLYVNYPIIVTNTVDHEFIIIEE